MRRLERNSLSWIFLIVLLATLTNGCRSGRRDDPIMLLSAEEALEQGKALLAAEKYYKARRHLTHAFEVEPNSRSGREALLLAADALYLQGSNDNFIKCEAKYRDFLNRFPTSDRADYAQFQIGNCLASRAEKPDRDQKVTRQAIDSFEEMLRLYPTSAYSAEARSRIDELTERLALHELVVADFYLRYGRKRRGICSASINRLEVLQKEYPAFERMDEVLYKLGIAFERCRRQDDAEAAFAELQRDYPDSAFIAQLEAFLQKSRKGRDLAAAAVTSDSTAETSHESGDEGDGDGDGGAEGQ